MIVSFPPRLRRVAAAIAAAALAASLVPGMPPPASAEGGSGFVEMVNGYRADSGRAPVRWHAAIDAITNDRAREMAAAGEIGHDFDALIDRFARDGICWRGFGEIVARNRDGDFGSFGEQWWVSETHHNVMLGDYTHASGSRALDADGRWVGVMIFVKLCGVDDASGFSDIGGSKFYPDILWLVEAEITAGCSSTRFCPTGLVSRGQMASFISRALDLPATNRDYFDDDDGNKHESNINRFAGDDLTTGCETRRYCPSGLVSRAQMATFLARALDLPATTRDYFDDDDGSPHEANINRVAAAGITAGCGDGRFCPDGIVTRGQMAAFLHRAFGD